MNRELRSFRRPLASPGPVLGLAIALSLLAGALSLSGAQPSANAATFGIGVASDLAYDAGSRAPLGSRLTPVPLYPAPHGGVGTEFWSDPAAGSLVHPGTRARLYVRPNADCYLTVFSIDTEGRVRLLFPGHQDDGWVEGGRTLVLPTRRAGYDLVFDGPPGLEYVYALATLDPVVDRYPEWMVDGRVWTPDPWAEDDDADTYFTGWVVGDPFYSIRTFCDELVPYPHEVDRYSTSYLTFQVSRPVSYPRYLCSDCHSHVWVDPYGPPCSAVSIRLGPDHCTGVIDFRIVFVPRYRYEVSRHWRPRAWHGRNWAPPDGRWVWSSPDRKHLRHEFADARGAWIPRGSDHRDNANDRPDRDRRDGDRNAWSRAHEERLESTVHGTRAPAGRVEAPDQRPPDPRPDQRPDQKLDRGNGRNKDGVQHSGGVVAPRQPAPAPRDGGKPEVRSENRPRGQSAEVKPEERPKAEKAERAKVERSKAEPKKEVREQRENREKPSSRKAPATQDERSRGRSVEERGRRGR